ncbi:unnamed protein product [Boreogadus saida]
MFFRTSRRVLPQPRHPEASATVTINMPFFGFFLTRWCPDWEELVRSTCRVATYGGGCGQLDRATGHFWWERPPQATPNPDHRAAGAGADAARDDAARDYAARDYAARDYAARDYDAARDEAAGDEAAGDEAAGVEAAGDEVAGDEVAGDEAAKQATPAAEAAMLRAGPPHLRKATRGFSKGWRSVATRPRPIKDIEST